MCKSADRVVARPRAHRTRPRAAAAAAPDRRRRRIARPPPPACVRTRVRYARPWSASPRVAIGRVSAVARDRYVHYGIIRAIVDDALAFTVTAYVRLYCLQIPSTSNKMKIVDPTSAHATRDARATGSGTSPDRGTIGSDIERPPRAIVNTRD